MVGSKMKEALEKKSHPGATPEKKDWLGIVIDKIMASNALKLTLIALAVAAVVALGVRIYTNLAGPQGTSANQAVLTVSTEKASVKPFEQHLKLTGTISARDPLTVGSEVGGLKVNSIQAEEGDFVNRGAVLATLNSSILQAQLKRELAMVTRAEASLDKTVQPNRPMDIARLEFAVNHASALISQEEANIVRAKANLANAKRNTMRYKQLRQEGAVSLEDLDNRVTTERTYEADLDNAIQKLNAAKFAKQQSQESLKLAREGGSKEDVSMAKADLLESRATVEHIRAQIAQTIIRAPEDGWIVKRHVHIGDISSVSQPFFEMVKNNTLEVRSELPEEDLPELRPGQIVKFSSSGRPNKVIKGRIREVSPMIDKDTRLAMARIDIPFDAVNLKPGMFLTGIVDLGVSQSLTVPSKAVLDRDGRKIVFIYENEKVFARTVTVGESANNYTQIKTGLKEGDEVVAIGGGFLKDGDIVRLGEEK